MEQLPLPALSELPGEPLTDWYEGPPPMMGWWDTVMLDSDMSVEQFKTMDSPPVWRRWWGCYFGEPHWSAAVTPISLGLPLIKMAMNAASLPQGSRIIWRGTKYLPEPVTHKYPLKAQTLAEVGRTWADLAEAWQGELVTFKHLSLQAVPQERIKVRVRATPEALQEADRKINEQVPERSRVRVRNITIINNPLTGIKF